MIKLVLQKQLGIFQTLVKSYLNDFFLSLRWSFRFAANDEFRQLLSMQFKNVINCINSINVLLSHFLNFNIDNV